VTHFYFVIANDINTPNGSAHSWTKDTDTDTCVPHSNEMKNAKCEREMWKREADVRAQRTFAKCEIIKQSARRRQHQKQQQ